MAQVEVALAMLALSSSLFGAGIAWLVQPRTLPIGVVPGFRQKTRLGGGNRSDCFRGVWQERQEVVLKIARKKEDPRTIHEIALLKELQGFGIVGVPQLIESKRDGRPYLITPWCNFSLDTFIERARTIPRTEASEFLDYCFRHLAWTLKQVHNAGVLHLDIAPGNILVHIALDYKAHVYLYDWELSWSRRRPHDLIRGYNKTFSHPHQRRLALERGATTSLWEPVESWDIYSFIKVAEDVYQKAELIPVGPLGELIRSLHSPQSEPPPDVEALCAQLGVHAAPAETAVPPSVMRFMRPTERQVRQFSRHRAALILVSVIFGTLWYREILPEIGTDIVVPRAEILLNEWSHPRGSLSIRNIGLGEVGWLGFTVTLPILGLRRRGHVVTWVNFLIALLFTGIAELIAIGIYLLVMFLCASVLGGQTLSSYVALGGWSVLELFLATGLIALFATTAYEDIIEQTLTFLRGEK